MRSQGPENEKFFLETLLRGGEQVILMVLIFGQSILALWTWKTFWPDSPPSGGGVAVMLAVVATLIEYVCLTRAIGYESRLNDFSGRYWKMVVGGVALGLILSITLLSYELKGQASSRRAKSESDALQRQINSPEMKRATEAMKNFDEVRAAQEARRNAAKPAAAPASAPARP